MDLADHRKSFPRVVMLSIIPVALLRGLQRYFVSSPASTGSRD